MINFFKKIFRCNFHSRAKKVVLQILEKESAPEWAMVFETRVPYPGVLTVYKWCKDDGEITLSGDEYDSKTKTHHDFGVHQIPIAVFEDMIRKFNELNTPPLGNFERGVKDGVFYSIAWGTTSAVSEISISTPVAGTRHIELVELLRHSAQEWTGKLT